MEQDYAVIYGSRIVDDKSYVRIQYFHGCGKKKNYTVKEAVK